MYFGYTQMWRLTFVPAGFAIVMGTSIAYALVYFVGAEKGKAAATRYVSAVNYALVGLSVANLAFGALTGDLGLFVGSYGPGPLFEMAVLGVMCVGSLWFMARAYVNSKKDELE